MNISARCEYACRAMVELTLHHVHGETMTAQQIAERRSIPEKYLVHILLQLKRAGLVHSVRGAQGGYALAVDPDQVTLLQIVEAIDGPVLDPLPVEDGKGEEVKATWKGVALRTAAVLREVTLRHMMEMMSPSDMYFI